MLIVLHCTAAESLDVLESWVKELFGNVKKGPQVNLEFKAEGSIWKAGKLYRLEAVKDVHILDLTWTLPCLHRDYLKKPEDYLAHLLGHGKIYIVAYLRCLHLNKVIVHTRIHITCAHHKKYMN